MVGCSAPPDAAETTGLRPAGTSGANPAHVRGTVEVGDQGVFDVTGTFLVSRYEPSDDATCTASTQLFMELTESGSSISGSFLQMVVTVPGHFGSGDLHFPTDVVLGEIPGAGLSHDVVRGGDLVFSGGEDGAVSAEIDLQPMELCAGYRADDDCIGAPRVSMHLTRRAPWSADACDSDREYDGLCDGCVPYSAD